jgi:hypothetical protein
MGGSYTALERRKKGRTAAPLNSVHPSAGTRSRFADSANHRTWEIYACHAEPANVVATVRVYLFCLAGVCCSA